MSNRSLLWVLASLAAASVVLLAVLFGGPVPERHDANLLPGPEVSAAERTPERGELVQPIERVVRKPARTLAEESVAVEVEEEILGMGEARYVEDAVSDDKVVVVVRLAMEDGSAYDFSGHEVEVQSWLAETEATHRHVAIADDLGVATFVFDGFVHIDWLRYEPSLATGLAFAIQEYHDDHEPGTYFEAVLAVGPGAQVHGRVEWEDGRPAAGVEVHAFIDYYEEEIADVWRPGIVQAVSGADGRFRFANLPARDWLIGVPLIDYLQLTPDITDTEELRSYFELEPGEEVDAGVFRVTTLQRSVLRVVDDGGDPRPDLAVWLEPVAFDSPGVANAELADEPVDRWMRGMAPTAAAAAVSGSRSTPWEYGRLPFRTDENGEVRLVAVAGTWDVVVYGPMAYPGEELARETIVLPRSEVTVVASGANSSLAGRLVDRKGKPTAGVWLLLFRTQGKNNNYGRSRVRTDETGRFEFTGLLRAGPYQLRVVDPNYEPTVWDFGDIPTGEATYEVSRAERLLVRVSDPSGKPSSRLRLKILDGVPRSGAALTADQAKLLENLRAGSYQTRRDGRMSIGQLFPGKYEVGVFVAGPQGQELWTSWWVETGNKENAVEVDLRDYRRPTAPPGVLHSGRVTDGRTGEPIYRARLEAQSDGGRARARTQGDGTFGFNLPAGKTTFTVMAPGFVPLYVEPADYAVGETRHEFVMTELASTIELSVVDAHGEPLPEANFVFHRDDRENLRAFNATDGYWATRFDAPYGRLQVGGLRPGAASVHVELYEFSLGRHAIQVPATSAIHGIEIRLERTLDEIRAEMAEAWAGE